MTASGYLAATARGIKTFAGDVGEGFFEITHNTLALLGIVVVVVVALLGTRPDLRAQGEQRLTAWRPNPSPRWWPRLTTSAAPTSSTRR